MFCPNCGRPVEDGQKLCPDCAAQRAPQEIEIPVDEVKPAETEASVEVVQPVETETPVEVVQATENVVEQPTFTVNTSMEEPPKKKKKIKLGWIIAGAVVVALVLTAVLCWPQISSFYNRTFLSPADYMVVVETNSVENSSLLNAFVSSYGASRENLSKNTGSANVDIALNMDDDVTDMVESLLASEGADIDLAWLNQILLELDNNVTDDGISYDIGVGLNNTRALTASVLFDIVNGMVYAGIPEVNDTYLSVDLEQTGVDTEMFSDMLTQMTSLSADFGKNLPSEAKMEEMLERYITIAFSQLEDVEKSTETVTVDGISQKFTVLETSISHEDAIKIAIAVLKEAKNDATLRQLITAYCDYTNDLNAIQAEMNGYSSYEIDPDDFFDSIDGLIEELESIEEFEDGDIILTTYVDTIDRICGRKITASEEDTEISYITVRDGSNFNFEFKADSLRINGSGTEKKDIRNGTYDLNVDGEDILTIKLIDMNTAVLDKGILEGTVRLLPGKAIADYISEAMNYSMAGTLFNSTDIALELKMGENSFEVGIVLDGKTLISLAINAQIKNNAKFNVPNDKADASNENDMMNWAQDLDFDQVLEKLETAGVPDEYIDLLKDLSQQMVGSSSGY